MPLLWTGAQLLSGGAGYFLYHNEINYWKDLSPSISVWSDSPYKQWAYTAVWSLTWSTIGLIEGTLLMLGYDDLFKPYAYLSVLAPLGTIGGSFWAFSSYSNASIVRSADSKFNSSFYTAIGVSALTLIIDAF